MKASYLLPLLFIYTSSSILLNVPVFAQDLLPEKVKHAEPIFADLVRDLGARKGEKEWNIGADFKNKDVSKLYGFLVEYEFAPINRLGLEVETDSLFAGKTNKTVSQQRLEGLRLSALYSFLVAPQIGTTLAIGYTHIFESLDFKHYGQAKFIKANVYNPFFIAAKRWASQFHSLLYTRSQFTQPLLGEPIEMDWFIHTSFHYYIPQTSHYVGVELNNNIDHQGNFSMTVRTQVKLKLSDHLALGMIGGIPIGNTADGFSTFFRLIYEP